jgi:CRP/FNR family transcriptional regulator
LPAGNQSGIQAPQGLATLAALSQFYASINGQYAWLQNSNVQNELAKLVQCSCSIRLDPADYQELFFRSYRSGQNPANAKDSLETDLRFTDAGTRFVPGLASAVSFCRIRDRCALEDVVLFQTTKVKEKNSGFPCCRGTNTYGIESFCRTGNTSTTYIRFMNIAAQQIAHLFPGLQKELVQEIAQHGELKSFREGDLLMRKGQYIRYTMLVLEGLIKIYREDDEGNEFFMYYLEGGKACALSLICATKQDTSELTAKAVTETKVFAIPLRLMDQWMTQYKSWYHFVVGTYRERFEELLQTIDHVAFRNMDERLVFYLKRHQEKLQTNIIPLTHTEIAQDLNSSREVITRLLKKLSDRGMLRLHRQSIEILELKKLV